MLSTSKTYNQNGLQAGLFISLIALSIVCAATAFAGKDATFATWTKTMTDWIAGSLGLGISIAFVLIGIIVGAAKQNLMAFAIGIGSALGLNYTPTILAGMFTATIL